jgi:hypothetical protein
MHLSALAACKLGTLLDLSSCRFRKLPAKLLQRCRLSRGIDGSGMVPTTAGRFPLRQHHRMLTLVEVTQRHEPKCVKDVVYFPPVRLTISVGDVVEQSSDAE